jgi:hypothetical protein
MACAAWVQLVCSLVDLYFINHLSTKENPAVPGFFEENCDFYRSKSRTCQRTINQRTGSR